jgi:hypothetical protein
MPLNSQEKRDAWPGNFAEFVLKIGGKPQVPKYPGHEFFPVVMKAKTHKRGEFRQLAAQMIMLFMTHRESGGEKLCDINRDAIDTFYYKHLDFDLQSDDAKRFRRRRQTLRSTGKRNKRLVEHAKTNRIDTYEAAALVDERTVHHLVAISIGVADVSKLNLPVEVGHRLVQCYENPSGE